MAPICKAFDASHLEYQIQQTVTGRRRKTEDGKPVYLKQCELLSKIIQYHCEVENRQVWNSPVNCWPVERLFRKCHDKKGEFMVETTAWEGMYFEKQDTKSSSTGMKSCPRQE